MQNEQLAELDALIAQAWCEEAEQAKQRKVSNPLGFIARLVTYGVLLGTWWLFQPSKNILSVPFAQLTLGTLLGFFVWIGAGIYLIKFLFTPSADANARDGWNGLGIVLVVGVVLGGSVYLWTVYGR